MLFHPIPTPVCDVCAIVALATILYLDNLDEPTSSQTSKCQPNRNGNYISVYPGGRASGAGIAEP